MRQPDLSRLCDQSFRLCRRGKEGALISRGAFQLNHPQAPEMAWYGTVQNSEPLPKGQALYSILELLLSTYNRVELLKILCCWTILKRKRHTPSNVRGSLQQCIPSRRR